MEQWGKDARREPVITDLDALVAKDHLLRKIERVMDYEWLYKRLSPYYCHDNGRPGTDPVVLIKMVLIQHLYVSFYDDIAVLLIQFDSRTAPVRLFTGDQRRAAPAERIKDQRVAHG